MTLTEAAQRLGLSPSTLRVQVRNGRLATTKHGRDHWITEGEVERYRREHQAAPQSVRDTGSAS